MHGFLHPEGTVCSIFIPKACNMQSFHTPKSGVYSGSASCRVYTSRGFIYPGNTVCKIHYTQEMLCVRSTYPGNAVCWVGRPTGPRAEI